MATVRLDRRPALSHYEQDACSLYERSLKNTKAPTNQPSTNQTAGGQVYEDLPRFVVKTTCDVNTNVIFTYSQPMHPAKPASHAHGILHTPPCIYGAVRCVDYMPHISTRDIWPTRTHEPPVSELQHLEFFRESARLKRGGHYHIAIRISLRGSLLRIMLA